MHFEIQKCTLKSRNPLWNPEIHFEIQKSKLKSRNPLDFEISYAEPRRDGPLGRNAAVYAMQLYRVQGFNSTHPRMRSLLAWTSCWD